ncbi:MAG TPA: regulatory iron-sulfur-containing complex subunit RicT [Spirochaetota bacterium]|jgi:cell fate regulator YaaT (PSP1 superfamily)|nr:regulatory iron-sulfur-containing complex subunit RicT [Spirochaetota bacterium]
MEFTSVKMRNNCAIYNLDSNNIFINPGSACIAETEHGVDIGYVLSGIPACKSQECEARGKILRLASDDDIAQANSLIDLEKRSFEECKLKAKEKNLDMTLVNVKAIFDKSKIIFYFVAENRVDFRELVRDLAGIFKTRIEMRQIGVRDKSRIIGGHGTCGQSLCCTKMRGVFSPVSIKMAKEQNLNLNSQKISGCCGRLLCCLDYEYEVYCELNNGLPQQGTEIRIGDNKCYVDSVDTLKQTIRLKYMDAYLHIQKNDITSDGINFSVSMPVIERLMNHTDEENEED